MSFLILCWCSLNCFLATPNTPWCRGFSSSHQRRLLGFSPRLESLGARRCETPSSSGSARQNNETALLILGGFVIVFSFEPSICLEPFFEAWAREGGLCTHKGSTAEKWQHCFEGFLFVFVLFVLREKVNLEVLVDLKLGVSLGWHKHFWTEKIQIKDCWIF